MNWLQSIGLTDQPYKNINVNEINREEKNEVICDCTGTTKEKVLSLIEQGADLDKISSATGACTGCGSCDVDITNLIVALSKK